MWIIWQTAIFPLRAAIGVFRLRRISRFCADATGRRSVSGGYPASESRIRSVVDAGDEAAARSLTLQTGNFYFGTSEFNSSGTDTRPSIPCTLRMLYMTSSSNRDWTRVWQALPISRACARRHVGVRLW